MKVLIIEDEERAAERMIKMLQQINEKIKICAVLESIEDGIKWFSDNPMPDLIFADINLADGQSFEIFKEVKVQCPIIFTTAYDQYAIQAFKFNSIDYLLKPIKVVELEESIKKYHELSNIPSTPDYSKIIESLTTGKSQYQKRLLVKYGQTINTIEIASVAYFFTEEKVSFACYKNGKNVPIDQSLDELEKLLDPSAFFRVNRQFIIHIDAIDSMFSFSKSRIKVLLDPPVKGDVLVSSERSAAFKEWLLGK